jgi:hypothetical protein
MESIPLSREEEQIVQNRILHDAYDRLVIGPGQALLAACGTVFGVGCVEGWCHLNRNSGNTLSKFKFVVRYGLAQIVPSLIWGQLPAVSICKAHNIDPGSILLMKELPAKRILAISYLNAIRGAIAGTVLISQVVSFAGVSSEAKEAYSRRVELGREPPLHVSTPTKNHNNNREKNSKSIHRGVVIRLAGKTSDVTSLTMHREGRRFLFPVYEDSSLVHSLLLRHGIKKGNDFLVPIFWQIGDGEYGHPESWSDLTIPQSWLFQKSNNNNMINNKESPSKLLILEADADHDGPEALSLSKSKDVRNLDLNLYEVNCNNW